MWKPDRDRMFRWALPLTVMFTSAAVARFLPVAYRPLGIVHALIGIIGGVLVHYGVAAYYCLDGVPLPKAQTEHNT
jgi:hypothetical protein